MGQGERQAAVASRRRTPNIEATPGVCGGAARIAGTRIAVWMLEQMWRLGETGEQILAAYPSLTTEDLADAWSYADEHREEIEGQIRENEDA